MDIESNIRILIVAEDAGLRFSLLQILNRTGLRNVTSIESGLTALHEASQHRFDLVIASSRVKHLSGWSFVREYKTAERIHNAVLVFVVHADDAGQVSAEQLAEYGIHRGLPEKMTPKDLMDEIVRGFAEIRTRGSRENLYDSGKALVIQKDGRRATPIFETLYQQTAGSTRSSIGLVHALNLERKDKRALDVVATLNARGDSSPQVLALKVRALCRAGTPAELGGAVAQFLKASPLPYQFDICAEALSQAKCNDALESLLQGAAKSGVESAALQTASIQLEVVRRNFEEARRRIEVLHQQSGKSLESLNLQGIILRNLGMMEAAKAAYREALAMAPLDPRLLLNLALTLAASGDVEGAIARLRSCLEVAPGYGKARDLLTQLEASNKEQRRVG